MPPSNPDLRSRRAAERNAIWEALPRDLFMAETAAEIADRAGVNRRSCGTKLTAMLASDYKALGLRRKLARDRRQYLWWRLALIDGSVDLSTPPVTRRFYGGCIGQSGHFIWDVHGRKTRGADPIPWKRWDGPLQPQPTMEEGRAVLHYQREEGGPLWTALSFWDRTVDSRPGSSSNFFADSHLSFADMLADAREHWPQIFERFTFEVVEADAR